MSYTRIRPLVRRDCNLGSVGIWPRFSVLVALSLVLVALAERGASAQTASVVINGAFETGDLSGWIVEGDAIVVTDTLDTFTVGALHTVAEGRTAARIGDELPWMSGGPQTSTLAQEAIVPPNDGVDKVLQFAYAVVANDPPSHPDDDKPFFRATVTDLTDQKTLYDTDVLFTSQTNGKWYLGTGPNGVPLGGPFAAAGGDRWVFQPWTQVRVDLKGLEGHRLRIEFTVRDCHPQAHAAYGYLDAIEIGAPRDVTLPQLVGNPQLAPFVGPNILGSMLGFGERSLGRLWWMLCCLAPLLLMLTGGFGVTRALHRPTSYPGGPSGPRRSSGATKAPRVSAFRPGEEQQPSPRGGFRIRDHDDR